MVAFETNFMAAVLQNMLWDVRCAYT